MNARSFDWIVCSLTNSGTRRGLLGLLAALPLAGGLALLPDLHEAAAAGRHRRRVKAHKHGRGRRKAHHKRGHKKKNPCAACPDGTLCDEGSCAACDVCPSGCAFDSVQEAIDAATAGDTIRICPGGYGRATIDKDLTLIGAGDGADAASNTTLDTAGSARVIEVSSGVTATLHGLRVTGGLGGVVNFGNALTMTGCTITENTGVLSGAGIINAPGSTLTMTGCVISANGALGDNSGGGLYNFGTVVMTACDITNNSAENDGGGIYTIFGGTTTVTECTVALNTARRGGGVFNTGGGTVTLDGSSVSGNTATIVDGGGGINNEIGTVTLQNGSAVTGNSEPNCVGTIEGSGCGP